MTVKVRAAPAAPLKRFRIAGGVARGVARLCAAWQVQDRSTACTAFARDLAQAPGCCRLLQDPTGVIGGCLSRGVMAGEDHPAPGAVLMLQQVLDFPACSSPHALPTAIGACHPLHPPLQAADISRRSSILGAARTALLVPVSSRRTSRLQVSVLPLGPNGPSLLCVTPDNVVQVRGDSLLVPCDPLAMPGGQHRRLLVAASISDCEQDRVSTARQHFLAV